MKNNLTIFFYNSPLKITSAVYEEDNKNVIIYSLKFKYKE